MLKPFAIFRFDDPIIPSRYSAFIPLLFLILLSLPAITFANQNRYFQHKNVKITLVSTMLADDGIGEWGFAAVIEAGENGQYKVLYDTGSRPRTVLNNAAELELDLTSIQHVVLSHHHGDHTGGLLSLRAAMKEAGSDALSKAHVAKGMFYPRPSRRGQRETNSIFRKRERYQSLAGEFIEHATPTEILPGIWVGGPVKRIHQEENYGKGGRFIGPNGPMVDNVPESQALYIATDDGIIVISGCGHAGIINIFEQAKTVFGGEKILAAIGGFHLLKADQATLAWTGEKMRAFDLRYFIGAHCTGLEAVYRLRELAGLSRNTAVVGAVGASFDLQSGIKPLLIAR